MYRYDRRARAFAAALAALAGYVDAIGFIALGGFFVSFMSGNSTRLGVGLGREMSNAGLAAGLILIFVCGVILGTLVGHRARMRRRQAALWTIALLLGAAAACNAAGSAALAIILMTLAMGAENTVFERDGEVSIGLTYMTGTLVKLGQNLVVSQFEI